MFSLIIDTSHEISYIILAKERVIFFFKKIEKLKLSKELIPTLDKILKETNTDLSNIKYIATSIGPGLFTGLRVGAIICKTLSFAKKIPLIGYVALEAYTPFNLGKFLSVFDAKTDGLYSLEGISKQKEITYTSEPKLISFEEAKKLLNAISFVISPDAEKLKEKFKNYKNKFYSSFLDPIRLLNITEKLYQNKKFTDFDSLNLLYLRGPIYF